jgi:hypothetical protein
LLRQTWHIDRASSRQTFLAHQRRLQEGHGRSNGESLFGLTRVPSDNHIRAMLNPAEPALLHPVFAAALNELEQADGLDTFRQLGGHVLIALDGTEYFRSSKRAMLEAAAQQWPDRILPRHAGRHIGGTWTPSGRAARTRVHRDAGWRRETGL